MLETGQQQRTGKIHLVRRTKGSRFSRQDRLVAISHLGTRLGNRTRSYTLKWRHNSIRPQMLRAGTAESCLQFVKESIDPVVLASTTSASFKLFLICAAVRWLSETNRIPSNTSVVLAKVSFQVLIPSMLFSKVVSILAMQPDMSLLLGMAIAAVFQILLGFFWGTVLSPIVDGKGPNFFKKIGLIPADSTDAAVSVAKATSEAMGVPHAMDALLPKPVIASNGYKSLMSAASAFGNSFTLPAVFLLSLLPSSIADRAVAYLGLFLLAWSPCLWSLGLYSIQRGYEEDTKAKQNGSAENGGIIDATAPEEKSTFSWSQMLTGALNPPVIAVLVAAILGLTPIGQALFSPGGMTHFASTLPFELSLVFYGLQNAYEVVEMLGGGTLAIQTLVLAASLLQPGDENDITPLKKNPTGIFSTIVAALTPSNPIEMRSLVLLSLVRFVLTPCSAIFAFHFLSKFALFHSLLSDKIFLFVIAVQTVMPSAQNLIIALQLSERTQSAAPVFAKLLLKLYAAAVLPVTLWVTAFASRMAIPLT